MGLEFFAAASDPIAAQFGRFGFTTPKAWDAALIFGAYLAGLASLHLGYRGGSWTWVRRHGLVMTSGKTRRLVSGFYPEMLLYTACAILVLAVDLAIRDETLLGVLAHAPILAGGLLALVVAVVVGHSASTLAAAAKDPGETAIDRRRLLRAYVAYGPYCVLFFCGGALVLVMLARQFGVDQIAFDREAHGVEALFTQARTLHAAHLAALPADPARAQFIYAQTLSTMETANGRVALATGLLQEQMNPVFIFATAVFAVNILIRFTPAKNAFTNGARGLTLASTVIAIGLCVLFGLYIYFYSYSSLLDQAIAALRALAPDTRMGAWDMTRRYNDMLVSVNESKNLFGFIKAIGGEGSGMATFVFGIQFALDRLQEREEKRVGAVELTPFKEWRLEAHGAK